MPTAATPGALHPPCSSCRRCISRRPFRRSCRPAGPPSRAGPIHPGQSLLRRGGAYAAPSRRALARPIWPVRPLLPGGGAAQSTARRGLCHAFVHCGCWRAAPRPEHGSRRVRLRRLPRSTLTRDQKKFWMGLVKCVIGSSVVLSLAAARSPTRAPAISFLWTARRSSCKASRSGAIPTAGVGAGCEAGVSEPVSPAP